MARRRLVGTPLAAASNSAVAFGRTAAFLASGSYNGTLRLWNSPAARPRARTLAALPDAISGLAFSPDGSLLASGGGLGPVRLWDVLLQRASSRALSGDSTQSYALAFSPDGTLLATGGADGAVRLWDAAYRHLVGTLHAGGDTIYSLVFNPAGTTLAAGSGDGSVYLISVGTRAWIRIACQIANRNMTLGEWQEYLSSAPYQQTCPNPL
jgi:WD40 repeat protein